MSRSISYALLKRKGACSEYRERFAALFGRKGRVRVNSDTLYVLAPAFNIDWAANILLTRKQRVLYTKQVNANSGPSVSSRDRVVAALDANFPAGSDRAYIRHAVNSRCEVDITYFKGQAFAVAYNSPKE